MRRVLGTSVMMLLTAACSGEDPNGTRGAADQSSYLFAPDKLLEFSLEIPEESWRAIDREANPGGGCRVIPRSYYAGALEFEGTRFEGVGIRAKGGCGSSRSLDDKAGLKINLRWDDPGKPGCAEKRELFGQRKLTFNNAAQDDSFTHDALTYEYFRHLGLPAPRVAQVRLNVNGEYAGLFNLVESIGRPFLKRSFVDHRGMMWEGAYGCDLTPDDVRENGQSCFQLEFDQDECDGAPDPNDDPRDYSLLANLAQRLDAIPSGDFLTSAGEVFDLNALLTYWAAERVAGHWDGYFGRIVNNYRVYHQPSAERFHLLPWGADQALRDDVNVFARHNVVADRCLSEPDCRARFASEVAKAAQSFEQLDLESELTRLEAKISPLIDEETSSGPSRRAWQRSIEDTRMFIKERASRVRAQLEESPAR